MLYFRVRRFSSQYKLNENQRHELTYFIILQFGVKKYILKFGRNMRMLISDLVDRITATLLVNTNKLF